MYKTLLLPLLLASTLLAQTFNVSTTPELRTALETAATNGEDDTIVLADGTYKTTDDEQGTFIYLSNEANSLTLQGSSSENVILSGDKKHQILNHDSTVDTHLFLARISFNDGNNTNPRTPWGGGVYSKYDIDILDCNISNNRCNATYDTYDGGGVSARFIKIKNSIVSNNSAQQGGGIHASNYFEVYDSVFYNNNSNSGGAIYAWGYGYNKNIVENSTFNDNGSEYGGAISNYAPIIIHNSTFNRNTASSYGGAIYSNTLATVTNSTFLSNGSIRGSCLYIGNQGMRVLNSILVNNYSFQDEDPYSSSIFTTEETNTIANSIFKNTHKFEIVGNFGSIVNLAHNFIDTTKVNISFFDNENLFIDINLGFVDEGNGDYNLTASSDLIDAGTTTIVGITLPETDLNGNPRISGSNIDIGPYEFSSTRPTISSFTYTGEAKEQNELTFNVDYTLADTRTIGDVSYDYTNDGRWISDNTYTFNTAGTYTVNVKVTDSKGEFSTSSIELVIAELPFSEMTYEQKLLEAINPLYYDELMALIASEKEAEVNAARMSGIALGENNVVLDPNSFGLVTQTVCDSTIAETNTTAISIGIETGAQYVQDNLTEFSLVTAAACTATSTEATTTGIATGTQYVLANPAEFSLVTAADLNTSVTAATNTGIETGKEIVIANPGSFGIDVVTPLANTDVDNLPAGWSMLSIPSEITDMSIFTNLKSVWYYSNGTWRAYSSNATTTSELAAANIGTITTLPAGSAVWVEK